MIDLCFHPGLKTALLHAPRRPESTEVLELMSPLFYGDISRPIPPASAPDLVLPCKPGRSKGIPSAFGPMPRPPGPCGLLFAVHLLQDAPSPLWAVPLAKEYRRPDGVQIIATHWGEVSPKELAFFCRSPRAAGAGHPPEAGPAVGQAAGRKRPSANCNGGRGAQRGGRLL